MAALLEVDGVYAGYGPIEVLKGISIAVEPGEIVALIGANGAGKTSTLLAVSGCLRPRRGRVVWQGHQIDTLPPHEIVRRGICHAPEGRKIFPRLTVLENRGPLATTKLDAHDTSPTMIDLDRKGNRDLLVGAEDGYLYYLLQ